MPTPITMAEATIRQGATPGTPDCQASRAIPRAATAMPAGISRRGATRSIRRAAICIVTPTTRPTGVPSSPVAVALRPRTCCQYSGPSSIEPK